MRYIVIRTPMECLSPVRMCTKNRAYEIRTFSHAQQPEMLLSFDAVRIKTGPAILNPEIQF